MKKSFISLLVIIGLFSLPVILFSKDEGDTPDPLEEGTAVNEEVVPVETSEESDENSVTVEFEEASSIDAGYRKLPWGTTSTDFENYVQYDDSDATKSEREISFIGPLGEDTVRFVYTFSDSGFWKVMTEFSLSGNSIDDYLKEFQRIEQLLTKKYGNPLRTTRNDLGTSREFLSSPFPRLFRGYYRSSWMLGNVSIELLLEVQMQDNAFESPVFSSNIPTMRLFYYNTEFYSIAEPEPTEIPEEKLLEQF